MGKTVHSGPGSVAWRPWTVTCPLGGHNGFFFSLKWGSLFQIPAFVLYLMAESFFSCSRTANNVWKAHRTLFIGNGP